MTRPAPPVQPKGFCLDCSAPIKAGRKRCVGHATMRERALRIVRSRHWYKKNKKISDRERMDWIEKEFSAARSHFAILKKGPATTARAAIDAAMRAERARRRG